ncbi:MAG: NAD(P)/FAD-dependent oxidoreductase [Campylobacteraceae bacterium]
MDTNQNCPIENNRRKALKFLGGAGVASLLVGGVSIACLNKQNSKKTKTSANIVIVGAGIAGLTISSKLSKMLDGANITIIDAKKEVHYQPGYTLIAAGLKPVSYTKSNIADFVQKGVNWIQENVTEIDPDSNKVKTQSGKVINYDYLVVATGLVLNYTKIEGMSESLIGKNGIGSIYHSAEGALATYKEMMAFTNKGGVGVFQRPTSEMKCAGAPIKYTCLTEDYLVRKGTRNKSKMIFNSQNNGLFSVPIISERIRMLWKERDVEVRYSRELVGVDADKKIATFLTKEGSKDEIAYDFLHVAPPMSAPDVVKNSPLPWQSGKFGEEGWLEVDKYTLRHLRYPNVFGIGDIAGVPKGKTGASIKWQAPVVASHIVANIEGKESDKRYNGYTSCPLLTRLGRAMLIEFDYENNLVPSFPGIISPLEEQWISWVMKTTGLKPNFLAMLRGSI